MAYTVTVTLPNSQFQHFEVFIEADDPNEAVKQVRKKLKRPFCWTIHISGRYFRLFRRGVRFVAEQIKVDPIVAEYEKYLIFCKSIDSIPCCKTLEEFRVFWEKNC